MTVTWTADFANACAAVFRRDSKAGYSTGSHNWLSGIFNAAYASLVVFGPGYFPVVILDLFAPVL